MYQTVKAENSIIIACSMLKDEIQAVMDENQVQIPVIWMEESLHEYPNKLRSELQAVINEHEEKEFILLAYGMCGNAIVGISHPGGSLIIPKFDDCIRMLLSYREDEDICSNPTCFYYTKSWMDSDKFMFTEFDRYLKKYGPRKGNIIINEMIKNYTEVCMLDTGVYNVEEYSRKLKGTFDQWKLSLSIRQGTLRILVKLLTGCWDQEFCIIEPGEEVLQEQFQDRKKIVRER